MTQTEGGNSPTNISLSHSGMLCGVLVSFLTTQTKHARHAEPLLVFSSAYMAFVVAEIFHWCVFASTIIVDFFRSSVLNLFFCRSGIISIIGFGLVVKRLKLETLM